MTEAETPKLETVSSPVILCCVVDALVPQDEAAGSGEVCFDSILYANSDVLLLARNAPPYLLASAYHNSFCFLPITHC